MARPQKQTVDYFPHRCKPGKTMFILETRYGDKGYTFWFKTLELLGSTSGHAYYFDKEDNCEYIQAYTRTTKEQAIEILDLLANLDAIDKDLWINNRIIWSDNFIDGIRDAYRNRMVDIPSKPVSDVRNPVSSEVSDVRNTQTKLKETKLKETIYIVVFDLWNSLEMVKHKKLTDDTKRAIGTASKDYSQEEICQAIKNYAEILKGDQYYFKYTWTLKDFLKRGMEKFLDLEIARQNYLEKKGGQDGAHRGRPRQLRPRGTYTRPEEY